MPNPKEEKKCCEKCWIVDYPSDRVGCFDIHCPCHTPTPTTENYCDSRTPEEREKASKIEVVTTYSEPLTTEKANFLQVLDTIACGHCEPDKGFDLPEKYGVKCDCVCHRPLTNTMEEDWHKELREIVYKYTQSTEDAGEMLKDLQLLIEPTISLALKRQREEDAGKAREKKLDESLTTEHKCGYENGYCPHYPLIEITNRVCEDIALSIEQEKI